MRKISLQQLLLLFFSITALLPIIIFTWYELSLFENVYKKQTFDELNKFVTYKVHNIEAYLKERNKDLEIVSKAPFTKKTFAQLEHSFIHDGPQSAEYKQLSLRYKKYYQRVISRGYHDIMFISLDRTVFFTHKYENDFSTNLLTGVYKDSGLAKAVNQSLDYLNPSTTVTHYYPPSNKAAVFITTPILTNGVLRGIIALQLDITIIHHIIGNETGLGVSGDTISAELIDNKITLTSPIKSNSSAAFSISYTQEETPTAIRESALGNSGSGIVDDIDKNSVVSAWRYLPSLRWGIVVQKDLSEALEPMQEFYTRIVITLLLLLLIVFLISVFLGRKLVIPLQSLEKNITKMITAKHLLPVKIKGFKESMKLAISFNKMTAQINEYQYNLEGIIEERTQALQRASQVIASTKQAIVITDLTPKIIEINHAYSELFDYSQEELLGKNPNIVSSKRASKDFYKKMWATLQKDGHWSGEIWNRKKSGAFIPIMMNITTIFSHNNEPTNYVGILTNIEILKSHEDQLHKLAYYDTLTQLPNRMLMQDRLFHDMALAKRNNYKLAVMFLDLDRFKSINDTLGHSAGDQLLQVVAQRLQANIRENDTVSRLGGDEFVILLDNIESSADAAHVAKNIINSVSKAISINDQNVFVGASIGISFYPNDAEKVEDLLKHADIAMYKAKENGKGTFQFYSDTLDKDNLALLQTEDELRQAIKENQLCLFYQPQINCLTGQLSGLEALIRWHHPEKGLVPPNLFIPIAESTGLIDDIDEWVLNSACHQLQQWSHKGLKLEKVAVNLSARHFENPQLTQDLVSLIATYQVKPDLLELEITERMLVKNPDKALNVMNQIAKLGIKLSIDDFGTGYSSLSYLKRFPISTLKIDKSFVDGIPDDPQDVAITHAIMSLAKSLEINVLAEGVETEQQNQHLIDQKCDEIQGYYHAKPMTVEELEQSWLN